MIERQKHIYGRVPQQVAVDGCYASTDNLNKVKGMDVNDAPFHKKRGLHVKDMVKSNWVYKKLCDFRAGVEGNISCLERRYGLTETKQTLVVIFINFRSTHNPVIRL